jgi:putative salt-induced outer membrane protein YdiY
VNSTVEVRRDARETRFNSGYYGSYGTAAGEENVNRHRVAGKFDWYLKRRFYVTLLDAAVVYDKFQNIQNRTTIGSGVGYWVIDWDTLEWELETGAAYQYTQNLSVELGQDPTSNDFAIRLSTFFKWDITGDLKFEVRHDTFLVATDFSLTTNHTRMKGSYEITDLLNLEITFVHSRVQEPVPLRDGTVPDQNDYQLVIGFGLELY